MNFQICLASNFFSTQGKRGAAVEKVCTYVSSRATWKSASLCAPSSNQIVLLDFRILLKKHIFVIVSLSNKVHAKRNNNLKERK